MSIPKLPFSLQDIRKYPFAVVLSLLLSYFVYTEFMGNTAARRECEDKDKQIDKLQSQLDTANKENKDLIISLLVKNGIIGAIEEKAREGTIASDSTIISNSK